MTLKELIYKAYLTATGRVASFESTDKNWIKLLQIANIFQKAWATEPGVDWISRYATVQTGTISNTDTYYLSSQIKRISNASGDFIRVQYKDDSSKYTNFTLVSPTELTRSDDYSCAKAGNQLKFHRIFTDKDPEYGGTILVSAFTYPNDLVNETDIVAVDDPNWLVFISAAEWVRNDLTLAQNYPNLINLANNSMLGMKQANGAQSSQAYKRRAVPSPRSW